MSTFKRLSSDYDGRVKVISFSEQAGIKNINEAIRDSIDNEFLYLVLDWKQIKEIDYPALGELIGLKGELKRQAGDFMIFNLSRELEHHFTLVGLSNLLTMTETEQEAVDRFQWQLNFESETMMINFPSTMDYVPGMRYLISQVSTMRGFSKKDAYRIETIVDELCNNAIEHGSAGTRGQIILKCMVDKEKLDLTIIDSGLSNPDDAHIEKLMNRAQTSLSSSSDTRGRGLPIVSMLADTINFSIQEGGTAVHVQKFKQDPESE